MNLAVEEDWNFDLGIIIESVLFDTNFLNGLILRQIIFNRTVRQDVASHIVQWLLLPFE